MLKKFRLNKAIKQLRKNNHQLNTLLSSFDLNNYEYAFVGSFVRAVCFPKSFLNSYKDIDVIVKIPTSELQSMLDYYKFEYTINDCKGFKVKTDNFSLDIWSFYDHLPFKYNLFTPSWKKIPASSFISLDGAAYTNKHKLYLGKIPSSIENNTVSLTVLSPLEPYMIMAKIIRYKLMGFNLLPLTEAKLKNFISDGRNWLKVRKFLGDHYSINLPMEKIWGKIFSKD